MGSPTGVPAQHALVGEGHLGIIEGAVQEAILPGLAVIAISRASIRVQCFIESQPSATLHGLCKLYIEECEDLPAAANLSRVLSREGLSSNRRWLIKKTKRLRDMVAEKDPHPQFLC